MRALRIEELELVAGGRMWDSTDGPWDNDESGMGFWGYIDSLDPMPPPPNVYHGGPLNGQPAGPSGPAWQQYDPNIGLYWHYDSTNHFVVDGLAPAAGATIIQNNSVFPSFMFNDQNSFWSAGGGAYGIVVGIFDSNSTGPGMYVGLGTPGASGIYGFTNDQQAYLTGVSGHVQLTPYFGYGGNDNSQAITFGTQGASLTYGMSFQQVLDAARQIGTGLSLQTYIMAGRPYDPPPPPPTGGGEVNPQ
jgi:hypothetical protein